MSFKIGDKVTRKWKPHLGEGKVTHILGSQFVVTWYGPKTPTIGFEDGKYLKASAKS